MGNVLRFPQVRERTGLSRSTVYRRIRCAKFPVPLDLGNGRLGWLEQEVDEWVAARPRYVPQGHGRPKTVAGEDAQSAPKSLPTPP